MAESIYCQSCGDVTSNDARCDYCEKESEREQEKSWSQIHEEILQEERKKNGI